MEFQSHIVVTSQSMNKKIGTPAPSALFTNKQMPNLIKQLWVACNIFVEKDVKIIG